MKPLWPGSRVAALGGLTGPFLLGGTILVLTLRPQGLLGERVADRA